MDIQANSITFENLESIFNIFMEECDIWNKKTGHLKSNNIIFIEEWKYHYARLSEITDAKSLFSCCEEIKLLLEEFIPILEAFQKERFSLDEKDEDVAFKKMSEAHTILYNSVKQELEKVDAFLERDRELKDMGYKLYECGTIVYENGMIYITCKPNGTLYYILSFAESL